MLCLSDIKNKSVNYRDCCLAFIERPVSAGVIVPPGRLQEISVANCLFLFTFAFIFPSIIRDELNNKSNTEPKAN